MGDLAESGHGGATQDMDREATDDIERPARASLEGPRIGATDDMKGPPTKWRDRR